DEDQTFPAALARALASSAGGSGTAAHGAAAGPQGEPPTSEPPARNQVEVLNAGVPGYNLYQERRFITGRAVALAPDAIVLVLIENDLDNVDGSDLVAAPDGTLERRPGSYVPDVNVNPFAALSGPWLWLQLHSVAFREASFAAIRTRLAHDGDRE